MKVLGKIYQYLEKFTFFRKVFDYISYIIRKKIVKEINPYLLKNTE
jgi:hypothetical protein